MQPDSPVAPADALRQVEAALRRGAHAGGCGIRSRPGYSGPYVCDCGLDAALQLLLALARQMVEGERLSEERRQSLVAKYEELHAQVALTNLAYAGLNRTREALAVAEGALLNLSNWLEEDPGNEITIARRRDRLVYVTGQKTEGVLGVGAELIAALKGAPTGTPKGEAE